MGYVAKAFWGEKGGRVSLRFPTQGPRLASMSLSEFCALSCVTAVKLFHNEGRAVAQAGRRRLLTAAAWVRAQVRSFGICNGQSGTEAGFLRVLQSS
jgi:hypothetical protein